MTKSLAPKHLKRPNTIPEAHIFKLLEEQGISAESATFLQALDALSEYRSRNPGLDVTPVAGVRWKAWLSKNLIDGDPDVRRKALRPKYLIEDPVLRDAKAKEASREIDLRLRWVHAKQLIISGELGSSEVWRALAGEFEDLPASKSGSPDTRSLHGQAGCGSSWQLVGNERLKTVFLELASRAGQHIRPRGCIEKASDCWLYFLLFCMQEEQSIPGIIVSSEPGEGGLIKDLIGASTDFCLWIATQKNESSNALPSSSGPVDGSPDKSEVAQCIRLLRERCGWTQDRLAEKVKLSRDGVARHEAGTCEPSANNLHSYGQAFSGQLGISIELKHLRSKSALIGILK